MLTPLQEFYKGKSIFITGGSGFMGKVLVEKLLYSCSEVKEVFILLRPKRGLEPQARLEAMYKLPVFQRITSEKPEVLKKVIPIEGDVTMDRMGISDASLERIRNTNIVFHLAATLKLEAELKDAIVMNTTGTKRVIELCYKLPKLQLLFHLSTAFCYNDQQVLLEQVYDSEHNPHDLIRTAEWMDVDSINLITKKLLDYHPNTYTYTKRLAEILVRDEHKTLPCVIARPSIVTPAMYEPVEGWVDSLNGPIGIMVAGGKGVLRSVLGVGEYNAEVIPVDMAINAMLIIAKEVISLKQKPKEIPVYNLTCSEDVRVSWDMVLAEGKRATLENPFELTLWYPNGGMTKSRYVHTLKLIFYQWLPAYIIDFLLMLVRKPTFMIRVQRKIADGLDLLQHFSTRQWDFKSYNTQNAFARLTPEDKKIFNLDQSNLDIPKYITKCILGGREYCLKESPSTLPQARRNMKILYVLDKVAKSLIILLMIWGFLKLTGIYDVFFESSSVEPEL